MRSGNGRRFPNRIFSGLAEGLSAKVMAELDAVTAARLTGALDEQSLAGLVGEMPPDAAADVLADMPGERNEGVLSYLTPEDAVELRDLMEHPEDTGGRHHDLPPGGGPAGGHRLPGRRSR